MFEDVSVCIDVNEMSDDGSSADLIVHYSVSSEI